MIEKKLDLPDDHVEYMEILTKDLLDTNQDVLKQILAESQYLLRITRLDKTYNMDKYFNIYHRFTREPIQYDSLWISWYVVLFNNFCSCTDIWKF